MKEQKTSIWERLRMAYRALTQDYYVFFGLDKDCVVWNDDGTYKELDKKKLSSFIYIYLMMKNLKHTVKKQIYIISCGIS